MRNGDSVEYARWAPIYDRIAREFGFDLAHERTAAEELRRLLPLRARSRPLQRLRPRLEGRDAIVVGQAPEAGPPPVWQLAVPDLRPAIVAADGAAATCLAAHFIPDVIVTDLDGPGESEITANHRGSFVVVHAHSDNRAAIAAWVSEFSGELAGSWAGPPDPELIDVGGFTDGDRAAFLAEDRGARRILLWGFDFERVREATPAQEDRKRAKLGWAARALTELARASPTPILLWRRDGTLVPYDEGRSAKSTR